MAWMKLEDTFRDDRKPKRLARELKISRAEARGLLAGLWSWAVTHAPDGDLGDLDEDEIAEAADYDGDAEIFLNVMIDVGFIDKTDDGHVLHGYSERAGSFREAQRKAERRRKEKAGQSQDNVAPCPRTVPGQHRPVSPDSPVREERRGEEKRGEERMHAASPPASVPLRADGHRETWTPGDSIASVPDWVDAMTQHWRWAVSSSPAWNARIERLLATGPIPWTDIAYALDQMRGKTSVPYFLRVLERTREEALGVSDMPALPSRPPPDEYGEAVNAATLDAGIGAASTATVAEVKATGATVEQVREAAMRNRDWSSLLADLRKGAAA